MKCLVCGTENQEGVLNCINCGNSLGAVPVMPQVVPNVESVVSQPQVVPNDTTNPVVNPITQTSVVQPAQVVSNPIQQPVTVQPIFANASQPTLDKVSNIGSVLPTGHNNQENDKNKNKKLRVVLILLIVLLVITIGIAVFVFIKGQEKLEEYEEQMENSIHIQWKPGDNNNQYEVGSLISLVDASEWYVLGQNGDMITLISKDNYGEKSRYTSLTNQYDESLIKDILETRYLPELRLSLNSVSGNVDNLKVRIITDLEVKSITGSNENLNIDSNYSWLYSTGSYWVMQSEQVDAISIHYVEVVENVAKLKTELESNAEFNIRPVIEINVSNIDK